MYASYSIPGVNQFRDFFLGFWEVYKPICKLVVVLTLDLSSSNFSSLKANSDILSIVFGTIHLKFIAQ